MIVPQTAKPSATLRTHRAIVDTVLAGLDRQVRAVTLSRSLAAQHDLARLRALAVTCRAVADMVDQLVGPAPVPAPAPVQIPLDCRWR